MSTSNKFRVAWRDIDWAKTHRRVRRAQRRIYKAAYDDRKGLVRELQYRLITSLDAKHAAVSTVTTYRGRSTAGVDGVKRINAKQKMKLAKSLRLDGQAQPVRRGTKPKPGGGERRPNGIQTIRDRAKQALAKLALEPEWEARFEPNAYGFRPGRCAHDAIEAIRSNLHHGTPKWVLLADIQKCFDTKDHDKLLAKLDTWPLMEAQILAWLKAGVVVGYAARDKSVEPAVCGTPVGGVISPLLANIALHGMEQDLNDHVAKLGKPRPSANAGRAAKIKALGVIRYGGDFVLIHENRVLFDSCVEFVRAWLTQNAGVSLNSSKTRVKSSNHGFQFLGFNVITVRREGKIRVKITPSKASCHQLLQELRDVLHHRRSASTYDLIATLRPKILGWANYFKFCECGKTFGTMTHRTTLKLRAWVFRRDSRKGRRVIKERYFPSERSYIMYGVKHRDNWVLVGKSKTGHGKHRSNWLPHMSWVPSSKHVKVSGSKSPYDGDTVYWGRRTVRDGFRSARTHRPTRRQVGYTTARKAP